MSTRTETLTVTVEHDPMTATAVFESREAAQRAADGAMPRRKHNRPYAQQSGWHWARALACPTCGAEAGAVCVGTTYNVHREREAAARAAGSAADRWIVCARPNIVMLRSGAMWDFARSVTVRQ